MSHPERDTERGGGGGGGGGGNGGGDGNPPSSGSATGAPSASASATAPSASASTVGNQPTSATPPAAARGSSTESESRRRQSDEEDEEADDDDDDEEEEEEEEGPHEDSGGDSSSRQSSQTNSSSSKQQSQSSSAVSPARRLPPMLRAPMGQQQQQSSGAPSGASQYAGAEARREYDAHVMNRASYGTSMRSQQQQQQYYETGPIDVRYGASQPSPRDAGTVDGGAARGLAQKRRLLETEYSGSPSASAGASSVRPMYETQGQHHPSSNSSSSTARSGGIGAATGPHHRSNGPPPADDDDNDDPLRYETRGAHGPRDETRYETWTSKQLRKKCSHLKLRGLKNVKKHVMVEALYRYYRNQRAKQAEDDAVRGSSHTTSSGARNTSGTSGAERDRHDSALRAQQQQSSQSPSRYGDGYASQRYNQSSSASNSYLAGATAAVGLLRSGRPTSGGSANMQSSPMLGSVSQRRSPPLPQSRVSMMRSSGYNSMSAGDIEESKYESMENEVRVTSEDVIRLVDVILSPEFVDRLAHELSRWQFWVDVREKYITLLNMSSASSYGAARGLTALGGDHHHGVQGGISSVSGDRLQITGSYSRSTAKWSSMQLWEMWKELTFAYTKTCFEFTSAGMRSVDERNYIQFCEGRPDVYYLHQRLHARPDLLHLIKSNEYIEEKCSSDAASDHMNMTAEKNAANALMGVGSPAAQRAHKRFKRIVPAGSAASVASGSVTGGSGAYGSSAVQPVPSSYGATGSTPTASGATNPGSAPEGAPAPPSQSTNAAGSNRQQSSNSSGNSGANGGPAQYLATNGIRSSPTGQQEEGSTENSETTGEEGSLEKTNSNATSDTTRREALAEQKYFGLLLQNFEAIFESLHNKKVLLAALRKDNNAPDHLIADLHDDIHVLSALKKEFRNKLRQSLE